MSGVNQVNLIGRLTRDPEATTLPTGTKKCEFSLAISETRTDAQGNKVEETEYPNCVTWSRLAEISEQYLTKGSLVWVTGKLKTSSWDDKTTGQKRYKTEVVVNQMQMLGGKSDSSGGNGNGRSQGAAPQQRVPAGVTAAEAAAAGEINPDDIPF